MELSKLVRKIKYKAGYPVVPIEVDDSVIIDMINDSLDDLQEYFNEGIEKTVSCIGNVIDLSEHEEIFRVNYLLSTSSYRQKEFNVFNPGTLVINGSINGEFKDHMVSIPYVLLHLLSTLNRVPSISLIFASIRQRTTFIIVSSSTQPINLTTAFVKRLVLQTLTYLFPGLRPGLCNGSHSGFFSTR